MADVIIDSKDNARIKNEFCDICSYIKDKPSRQHKLAPILDEFYELLESHHIEVYDRNGKKIAPGQLCEVFFYELCETFYPETTPQTWADTSLSIPAWVNPDKFATWTANSCYMDSLLTVMLQSDLSDVFIRKIIMSDKPDIENINDIDDIIDNIRRALVTSYNILHGKITKKFNFERIRTLISLIAPQFSRGRMEGVVDLYNLIVKLFPALLMEIPYHYGDRHYQNNVETLLLSSLKEPSYNILEDGRKIPVDVVNWVSVENEYLVFANQFSYQMDKVEKDWREDGFREKLSDDDIICSYKLTAVIVLLNPTPIGGAGLNSHFIAYFHGRDFQWWKYDDTARSMERTTIDKALGRLVDRPGKSSPAMVFYRKSTD